MEMVVGGRTYGKTLDNIKKLLITLGFNVDSKGVIYWIDAILYIKRNPLEYKMMVIYEHRKIF